LARNDGQMDAGSVVSIVAKPATAVSGGHGELTIMMRIAPGYHVMSNHPSRPEHIATSVTMGESPGLSFGDAAWPAPSTFYVDGEPISAFEDEIVARVPLDSTVGTLPGSRAVQGAVRFQACTRSSCLVPSTVSFETRLDLR